LINFEVYGSVNSYQGVKQILTGEINSDQTDLSVFPTFVTDHFTLKNGDENSKVSIIGVDGKIVFNSIMIDNQVFIVKTLSWRRGLYLVKIQNGEKTISKKIILY